MATSARDMLPAFRAKLSARGDRGLLNLLKDLVLIPRNPFEPDRRRLPRRELVTVGALLLVLVASAIWFNWRAR